MKFVSLFGILAVACVPLVLADNASKVKVVKAPFEIVSSEYIDPKSYKVQIIEVNSTYNRMVADLTILKDLPLDTNLFVKVYQAPANDCENYKRLNEYTVSLCNDSLTKFAQYLPDDLLALKKSGKCLTKGQRHIENAQPFKFYNLLTEEQLKNSCFKTITALVSGTKYLYSADLEFVSN